MHKSETGSHVWTFRTHPLRAPPQAHLNACRQVTVITGGGCGHEPAFGGYVGPGFLTAAVCGGVFASPAAAAVLAAIRAGCGPAGCLVIIMNYTGDRLNFGMAVVSGSILAGFNPCTPLEAQTDWRERARVCLCGHARSQGDRQIATIVHDVRLAACGKLNLISAASS